MGLFNLGNLTNTAALLRITMYCTKKLKSKNTKETKHNVANKSKHYYPEHKNE